MFHILVYLTTGAEEDIGIAVLVVKFGDGAVVATQTRSCQEDMYILVRALLHWE